MCKFNQNLFLVTLVWCIVWLSATRASPIDYLLLGDSADDQSNGRNDFDMRFDQRQNGTENFRLRVDGVLIAFPSVVSSSAGSIASNAAATYLLDLAAAVEDDDNDNDTDNYFHFLKNSNDASASETASAGGKKNTEFPTKNDKLTTPTKEGETKNVIIIKENEEKKSENSSDLAKKSSTLDQQQVKLVDFPFVPVKKIQSRRKNK